MMWLPRVLCGLRGDWGIQIKNDTDRLARISGNRKLRRASLLNPARMLVTNSMPVKHWIRHLLGIGVKGIRGLRVRSPA
jgi:hypothetical protein